MSSIANHRTRTGSWLELTRPVYPEQHPDPKACHYGEASERLQLEDVRVRFLSVLFSANDPANDISCSSDCAKSRIMHTEGPSIAESNCARGQKTSLLFLFGRCDGRPQRILLAQQSVLDGKQLTTLGCTLINRLGRAACHSWDFRLKTVQNVLDSSLHVVVCLHQVFRNGLQTRWVQITPYANRFRSC